jgi:nicotinamidase-related amidase
VGFSLDRCVGLTALDAWERDFRVVLAGDAVLGTDPVNGQLMLDYLTKAFAIEPVSNAEVKRIVEDGLAPVYNGTT